MRYHIATGVYKKFSILSIAFVFALTSVSGAALPLLLNKVASAAETPQITHVGPALINASNYSGITVTVKTQHVTTADNITVTVNRASGAPVVKTAQQSVLNTINADDGLVKTVSAPIVIKNISYNEAGSSSWNAPVNPVWTAATIPQSVTVSITGNDGLNLAKTENVTGSSLYAGMAPLAPQIHSLRYSTINSSYKGIVIDQYLKDFSDAISYKATIHRADGSSVSREGGVDTVNLIKSGGNKALTTPFNFDGNFDGGWFDGQSAIWTPATKPTGVTIEVVTQNHGTITLSTPTSQALVEGAGKLYNDIIPAYPPATTINVDTRNGLAGNTFTVSGDASAVHGLNRVYVQLVHRETSTRYGGTTINLLPHGSNYQWSQTYDATKLNLPEGTYAAHVAVVDRNGKTGSAGWTSNFTLDKTSPAFAIVTPTNNSTVNGMQRVSAQITDTNDIQKVLMSIGDGKGNYTWEAGKSGSLTRDGNTFYIDVDTNTLPEGVNHVVLRATDGAGNTRYWNNNSATRQHSYKVDNTAPTAVITSPDNESFHNDSVDIRGTVQDAQDNLRHYYVKVERQNSNGSWSHVYSKTTVTNEDFDNKTLYTLAADATEGRYRVQLSARDSVGGGDNTGNRSGDVYTYFTVDKTNPVSSSLSTDRSLYGGIYNTIAATGTITDSNIEAYRFSIDGTVINTGWVATAGGSVGANLNAPGASGSYTVHLEARDKAGNTNLTTTSITVDNDADLTISGISNNATLSGFETITASLNEDGTITDFVFEDEDGDEVAVTGTTTTPAPGQLRFRFNTAQLANGEYTVIFTGTDALGNAANPVTVAFEVFNAPFVPNANTGTSAGGEAPLAAATSLVPTGLVVNAFNTNNPQVLGVTTQQANTGAGSDTSGKVKASATSKNEKELVESASGSFAWYWILLALALLATMYYAYRNWKLQKANQAN